MSAVAEKRQFNRTSTTREAYLSTPQLAPLACVIVNYCPQGVMVRLPAQLNAPLSGLLHQLVTLKFIAGHDGTSVYRFTGQVKRTAVDTLGIEVARFHPDTYQELSRSSVSETPPLPPEASNTTQQAALISLCQEYFTPFIQSVLTSFFERIESATNETSMGAINLDERWALNSLTVVLNKQRGTIEQAFLRTDYGYQLPDTVQKPDTDITTPAQLSLMDVNDFEDWLNTEQAINALEFDFKSEIHTFADQFAHQMGQPTAVQYNPYCPYVLVSTLRQSIAQCDFTTQNRALIYKTFQAALADRLKPFYRDLINALPKPAKPIAASKPSAQAHKAITSESSAAASDEIDTDKLAYQLDHIIRHLNLEPTAADSEPHAAQTASHFSNSSAAHTVPTTSGAMHDNPSGLSTRGIHSEAEQSQIVETLLNTLNQNLVQTTTGMVQRTSGASMQRSGYPATEPSMVRTTGNLWSALRQMQDDQAGTPPRQAYTDSEQNSQLENILDALNQMRTQPTDGVDESQTGTFKQRLITALPTLAHSEARSERHFQAVEMFDALVSQPLATADKGSDIAALLKKLELPLLKLALTDEKFLGSDSHVARQTINLFERYYVAADDAGKVFDPELLSLLDGLANRVVTQFETHPAIFEEVNTVLQKLLTPLEETRQRKSIQFQLNAEAHEKIRLAREQVDCFMSTYASVPTLVIKLIQQIWQRHLQLICLREGCEHPAFTQAIEALESLLSALSAPRPLPAPTQRTLMQALMPGLKAVLLDPASLETWINELNAAFNGDIDIVFAPYPKNNTALTDQSEVPDRLKMLQRADWLYIKRDGGQVPYQLIWFNPTRKQFMFINRSATSKYTVDSQALISGINTGEIQSLNSLSTPFMQRSAHSVMLSAYERLYQQAIHDPESGLLNRKGMMNVLDKLFIPGLREAQRGVLCLLVFDQLKVIHQNCEQAEAESSLLALIATMRAEIRQDDVFSRLGEDTFIILFQDRPITEVHAITLDILARIAQHRIRNADKSFAIGVNVGLAEITDTVTSSSALLKNAASACVAAKSRGTNSIQIYQDNSTQIQDEEALFEWAGLIDKALSENLLHLRCQKIQPIHANAGLLPHYEILLGLDASLNTNPLGFVRAAEKWNRSPDLDLWVVRNALAWLNQHAAMMDNVSGFSINLSGLSLVNQTILDTLTDALAAPGFPIDKVIFEVTETAAIHHLAAAQNFIAQVKALGCRVSLDDFGSGYSSFAYLKNLDVDYLKIDGAFVRDLLKDKADRAMVKSMHDVGHALGLKTIAEYVENAEILEQLREIGVDYAQGWAIAKPVRLDSLQLD
ncbi:MAG: DUF1631 family protein [Pseudomonadota bacterium]